MLAIVPPLRTDPAPQPAPRSRYLVGGLVIALALSLWLRDRTPPLEPVVAVERAAEARLVAPVRGSCGERFLAPFAAHTGIDAAELALANEELLAERVLHVHDWIKARYGRPVPVEVMIATIPDPAEPGLRAPYEALLPALTMGVEHDAPGRIPLGHDGDFTRDREWLPWEERAADAPAGSEPCREEWPGVRLFRGGNTDRPRFLALLLVGETPVKGVYARALSRAFEISRALQKSWRSRSPLALLEPPLLAPVGLVGPSFSASALSLRQAVDLQRRKGFREPIDVIAGAELSAESSAIMRRATFGVADPTRYATTSLPTGAAECAMLQRARELGAATLDAPDAVGIVVGVAFLRDAGDELSAPHGASPGQLHASGHTCGLKPELELTVSPAVSADNRTAGGQAPSDAQLGQLARRDIRWLAIRAADAKAALSLARSARALVPAARVAFLASDPQLVQTERLAELGGALIVSPYPFLGERALAGFGGGEAGDALAHAHGGFPGETAQAVFNAARALRGSAPDELTEYVLASAEPELSGTPSEPLPVWTAVVGRKGLAPLTVRPTRDCERALFGGADERDPHCGRVFTGSERDEAQHAFDQRHALALQVALPAFALRPLHGLLALLAIACVVHRRFHALQRAESFAPDPSRQASGAPWQRSALELHWLLNAALTQGTMLFAALCLAAMHRLALRVEPVVEGSSVGRLALAPYAVFGAVALGFVALDLARLATALLRLLPAAGAREKAGVIARLSVSLLCNGGLACALAVLTLRAFLQHGLSASELDPESALFVARSLALDSGSSPWLPLCLALGCALVVRFAQSARLSLGARSLAGAALTPQTAAVGAPISRVLAGRHRSALAASLAPRERALLGTPASADTLSGFAVSALGACLPAGVLYLVSPSTLEVGWTRWLLLASLAGGAALGGAAWAAVLHRTHGVHRALDAVLSHPVGRLLVRSGGVIQNLTPGGARFDELALLDACSRTRASLRTGPARENELEIRRITGSPPARDDAEVPSAKAALREHVIDEAADISSVLDELTRERRMERLGDTHAAWVANAQSFVAAVIVVMIRPHLQALRRIQQAAIGCSWAVVAITAAYPFGPQPSLTTCATLASIALMLGALYADAQLDRRLGVAAEFARNEPKWARAGLWLSLPITLWIAAQSYATGVELAELAGSLRALLP